MKIFNRVLFLQAPVPGPHNRLMAKPYSIPPLGLGYIASVLLLEGFDVRIIDMDMEDCDYDKLIPMLENFQPDIIGISTTTLTYKNGLRVAKSAKNCLPEVIVCLGGPHVSALPGDALKYPFIDIIVRGEGEISFLKLCRELALGKRLPLNIDGVSQRINGKITIENKRQRITELDALPFPARHLMPLNLYNIPGTILTSRGCPGECGFCAGPTILGRKYIMRSAENVINEVQTCVDFFKLTSFYFVDDTMTHNTKRLLEICEGLKKIKIPSHINRKLKWTCESRVDVISLEILQEMKKAGCTTIQFGMESGSQQLLDQLGKKITLKQLEMAVALSRQAGISPVLSMVFPHPNENEETLGQTFRFIRHLYELGAEKIVPSLLTLFPGTTFYENRDQLGLKMLTDNTDEFNLGTPILTTRYLNLKSILNNYSKLIMLTQQLDTGIV
jgi:radical SAM superfamily enzyme YgiQ (UPF0313 family)